MPHERRVFVTPKTDATILSPGDECLISPEDSRHLLKVIRLKAGAPLTVVDSRSGQEFEAVLSGPTSPATVRLVARRQAGSTKERTVASLLCALCKGKKNDWIIEKATEFGVRRVIFWEAERSVVKFTNEK